MRALARWLALGALALIPLDEASAQLTCLVQSKAALLPQFSDNATPGSISPANVRNIICSALLGQGAGTPVVPLAPTTSPFLYTFTASGTLVVSSGAVSISRDNGVTFYQAGTLGGSFPVLTGDQVKIVWYEAGAFGIPQVTFFPSTSP